MHKTLISFILGFGMATSAHADWQYTKWGMSAEQVVAASGGSMQLGSGKVGQRLDGYTIEVTGQYKSGSRIFDAILYFKNGSLALVTLDMKEAPRCYALANDLKGLYGAQFDQSRDSIMNIDIWHDRVKNNSISLLAIGDSCNLRYKPLKSEETSGL
jgi:hypothetical protein